MYGDYRYQHYRLECEVKKNNTTTLGTGSCEPLPKSVHGLVYEIIGSVLINVALPFMHNLLCFYSFLAVTRSLLTNKRAQSPFFMSRNLRSIKSLLQIQLVP